MPASITDAAIREQLLRRVVVNAHHGCAWGTDGFAATVGEYTLFSQSDQPLEVIQHDSFEEAQAAFAALAQPFLPAKR